MVNAKKTKTEFEAYIEERTNDVQEELDQINDAIDEYNLHLEFLGDLLPILNTYHKGAVGFAMDHVIQQRNELLEKHTKLLRKQKVLSRHIGDSHLF